MANHPRETTSLTTAKTTAAVRRALKDNGVEAAAALVVLAEALAGRHVDCELRKRGKRPAWTPGNERANSLIATLDTLFQAKAARTGHLGASPPGSPPPTPDVAALQALISLLTVVQMNAQKTAKLEEDDDDEPPRMRLVTD